VSIYPSLTAWFKFFSKPLAIGFAFLMLSLTCANLIKGIPLPNNLTLLEVAAIFLCLVIVVPLLAYLCFRSSAWSIDSTGLKGRSYWGRHVELAWPDIERVVPTLFQGIPYVVVTSQTTKREIYACILGADLSAIQFQLLRSAGPHNVLTELFASASKMSS
jgi:hypothetical protein